METPLCPQCRTPLPARALAGLCPACLFEQGAFDTQAEMYRRIAEMTQARAADARLRRGRVVVRTADNTPGILAVSRVDDDGETLVVFNTSTEDRTANVCVELGLSDWRTLIGQCPASAAAPGAVSVSLPALGYLVCVSERPA